MFKKALLFTATLLVVILLPGPAGIGMAADTGPEPETEHLDLAEAGSELLTEEQRRRETPPAPDTSHIQIEYIDDGS